MRHDWILDVLADLRSYAVKNDLPALARKVEEALDVARAEITRAASGRAARGSGGTDDPADPDADGDTPDAEGDAPPKRRAH